MNHPLKAPFTYVHDNTGDRKISKSIVKDLVDCCGATVYGDTVTISCHNLLQLGELACMCEEETKEGPEAVLRAAIGHALTKFIGSK